MASPLFQEWVAFSTLIRVYFVAITLAAIGAGTLPFLKNSILDYGKLNEKAPNTKLNRQRLSDRWAMALRSLTVPKHWFAHFYVWATIWMAYLTFDLYALCTAAGNGEELTWMDRPWSFLLLLEYFGVSVAARPLSADSVPWFLLGLNFLHVMRRWYESWYVERPSPTARMHVGHYLIGITFYIAVPPALWIDAVEHPERVALSQALAPSRIALFTVGFVLFVWAFYHQHACHRILGNLRPKPQPGSQKDALASAKKNDDVSSSSSPISPPATKSSYKVPHGDWFEYLVCPHYVAEMLIYVAYNLMESARLEKPQYSTTLLIVLVWVISNLSVVARETATWYRATFGDQWTSRGLPPSQTNTPPRQRWILVPFVY
ncbi:Steroid 5 alpha-reductase 3 [Actinomortierella ambigua]|nr:Steroid 5 alpha-reductase 3 [Actinomortierella ambigua]